MDTSRDQQKQSVIKLFLNFVGHNPTDSELFECEQSLYFLGRAVFRFEQLKSGVASDSQR